MTSLQDPVQAGIDAFLANNKYVELFPASIFPSLCTS